MWCIPEVDDAFRARMNDVLTLYAKPYNADEPVLCFDEKLKQLLGDIRTVLRARDDGRPRRRDYGYRRNGTRNLFVTVEPKGGFRTVRVTKRRTKEDWVREIKRIVSLKRYADATTIHIVLDNLNTHTEQTLIDVLGAADAQPILDRIQLHHTPPHASWLNMAEIEISVLSRTAINGRIPSDQQLRTTVCAYTKRRNKKHATIQWTFTKKDARRVFKKKGSKLN